MRSGAVTTVDEALRRNGGGRAVTLACPVLEQRAERIGPGETRGWTLEGRSELLFVTAGEGVLRVGDEEHALAPETGACLAEGEAAEVESSGPGPLELVVARAAPAACDGPRRVRFGDETDRAAGIGREFRLLAACTEATQFVGIIPPGRANMHNHPYDEVAVVVEGEGVLHWEDGTSVPVRAGSCIYFPRLVFHSLENVGGGPIRIMGVFHPAGSPADRVAVLDH